jgi:drug/metabolite transporter (DMT)-like permease
MLFAPGEVVPPIVHKSGPSGNHSSDLPFAIEGEVMPARASEVRGLIEVFLAMALAGSSVVVGKLLSTRVPIFLSAELSLCAALAAILPLQLRRRRELRLLDRRQLGFMFLQALFGIVLFRVCTLSGLRLTSAVSAGLITSAAPAVTALFSAALLRERIGVKGVAGIALAVGGLCIVNVHGISAAGSLSWAGNLLVGAAVCCEALLTIFRKRSGGSVGSVTNTTVLVAMSALMLLPFAIGEARRGGLQRIEAVGWAAIVYYGAVATVAAYILWGDGALRIPAHRVGVAMAAMPVSSLALSWLLLGEPVGARHLLGCAVVVAGIVVATLAPRPALAPAPEEVGWPDS